MVEKSWHRTNEFRFVSKTFFVEIGKSDTHAFMRPEAKMILQQRFELRDANDRFFIGPPDQSEWRDVPVVSE